MSNINKFLEMLIRGKNQGV